ncbi:hypothetical protein BSF41_03920 [Flavobacterium sp. ACN2]|nr:hypothetical protein BSF41_03920 [Flavobacterium sp. ACN2]
MLYFDNELLWNGIINIYNRADTDSKPSVILSSILVSDEIDFKNENI